MTASRTFSNARGLRCVLSTLCGTACLALAVSASAETKSVRVASANFRAGPSTEHPVIFSADRFYPVEIIEHKDKWLRIRDFEGDTAWVAGWLLCEVPTVVVKKGVVNVREKPNTKSAIVHTAERGAVFKRLGAQGIWVQVGDEEGEIGWIHQNLLWGLEQSHTKRSDTKRSDPKASDPKASDPKRSDPKASDPKTSDPKPPEANPPEGKQSKAAAPSKQPSESKPAE